MGGRQESGWVGRSMELRVCDEIMQVQSPRQEILSFKLISENARRSTHRRKAELFAPLERRVMHTPLYYRAYALYHLLPLDRFQSRIEPFVTVERELWRLFILACSTSASTSVRATVDLSALSKSAFGAGLSDYITAMTSRDHD